MKIKTSYNVKYLYKAQSDSPSHKPGSALVILKHMLEVDLVRNWNPTQIGHTRVLQSIYRAYAAAQVWGQSYLLIRMRKPHCVLQVGKLFHW